MSEQKPLTNEDIFDLLTKETEFAIQTGQVIDMRTTGLTLMDDESAPMQWIPQQPLCPRCVIGIHLANKLVLGVSTAPSVAFDLELEFGRPYVFGLGLLDGTLPNSIEHSSSNGEGYLTGFEMGRNLLEWVYERLPGVDVGQGDR